MSPKEAVESGKVKLAAQFSLPYRDGMETETGFKAKSHGVLKAYSEESQDIATFSFDQEVTLIEALEMAELTEAEAAAVGAKKNAENRLRNSKAQEISTKYGVSIAKGISKALIGEFAGMLKILKLNQGKTDDEAKAVLLTIATTPTSDGGNGFTPEYAQEVISKL